LGLQHVDVTVGSAAPPAAVYALLRNGSTWPQWGRWDSFTLERAAADEPEGVGAIRVWRVGRKTVREEIVELVPDRRFSYTLLSGLALRDYRADVALTPTADGCIIRWRSTFRPKVPGTGWLYRRALHGIIEESARAVANAAAGKSSDTSAN
jgi:uncharacterized protein YndB with AHSA1/START domain